MGFNPKNYEERTAISAGIVSIGVIISVNDGVSGDFLTEEAKKSWQGGLDVPAINLLIEIMYNGLSYKINKLLTYRSDNGKTLVAKNSNLGKYLKRYRKLPEVGDQVQCLTSSEGYWRILID